MLNENHLRRPMFPAVLRIREDFRNAKKRIKTENEVEDASRCTQALQGHGYRENFAWPYGQAPLHRPQGLRAHAQAEEADNCQCFRCSQHQADAALRLDSSASFELITFELADFDFRARQRFTGACRPIQLRLRRSLVRVGLQPGIVRASLTTRMFDRSAVALRR